MTAYRASARGPDKISTVETDGLVEMLRRTRLLRKRVALPTLAAALVIGIAGAFVHGAGLWSVFGPLDDGSCYVSFISLVVAALVPASPVLVVGGLLYAIRRRALRSAWTTEFRARPVEGAWPEREAWLAETARRFD